MSGSLHDIGYGFGGGSSVQHFSGSSLGPSLGPSLGFGPSGSSFSSTQSRPPLWSHLGLNIPSRSQASTPSLDRSDHGSGGSGSEELSVHSPLYGSQYGGSQMSDSVVMERLSKEVQAVKGEMAGLKDIGKKLDTLLAMADNPRNPKDASWIRDAYAAYDRLPVIAPKSAELAQLKQMFPNIKYWNSTDFTPPKKSDVAGSLRKGRSAGSSDKKKGINNAGQYVERADGEIVDGVEFGEIRETLNVLLTDLLAAGKTPSRLSLVGEEVRGALVYKLEQRYPYLQYCTYHWKALRVIQGRYGAWARPRVRSGQIKDDGDDVDDDADDDDDTPTGAKRKSLDPDPQSKRRRKGSNAEPAAPPLVPTPAPAESTSLSAPPPPPATQLNALPPSTLQPHVPPPPSAQPHVPPPPSAQPHVPPPPSPQPHVPPPPSAQPHVPLPSSPQPHVPPPPSPQPDMPHLPAPQPNALTSLVPPQPELNPVQTRPVSPLGSENLTVEDVLENVVVHPPSSPPLPPTNLTTVSVPPVVPEVPASTKGKPCKPHPKFLTARNLCCVVFADEKKGTAHEFEVYWTELDPHTKAAFTKYENELKSTKPKPAGPPTVDVVRLRIAALLASPA